MTVSNTVAISPTYNGNDVTVDFATSFYFLDETDLSVLVIDSDGTINTQELTTDYTVAGAGEPSGGTVTMIVAPATGQTVRILRIMDLTQDTDYIEGTAFPATTHESALDKLTLLVQQVNQSVARSPQLPLISDNYPIVFPDGGEDNAHKLFRWDGEGDALELVSSAALAVSGNITDVPGIVTALMGEAYVARTLTGTANELTVTNGTGVSGNPTISIPSAVTFTGKTVTGGTFTQPVITVDADELVIQDQTDITKDFKFNLSGLTTATTRTATIPDADFTVVGTDTTQTLTAKTLTSPVLNTAVSGTAVLDEDDMVSNSATQIATQQSIKAYVDATKTDILDGSVFTGIHDFGGATSIEIPNGTSPTVNVTGQIAMDTNGDGVTVTTGVLKGYDGTNTLNFFGASTYPAADNDVLSYDAATNALKWEAVTGLGGLANVVEDTTPQLGGMLDVNGFSLGDGTRSLLTFVEDGSSVNNIEIENNATGTAPIIRAVGTDTDIGLSIQPKGTGRLVLDNLSWPAADGTADYFLKTDGAGSLSFAAGGGGLANVVEDTTPQLGGMLDVNGQSLGDGTRALLTFVEDGSSVNNIEIENNATGSGPIIRAVGTDTDIDLVLQPKGAGRISLDGVKWPAADGSANQSLKTDGSGSLSFYTPSGGGAMTFISKLTPSAAATTEWASLSGYHSYLIIADGLLNSAAGGSVKMRIGTGGSISSSGVYRYLRGSNLTNSTTLVQEQSTTATSWDLGNQYTDTNARTCLWVRIFEADGTANYKQMCWGKLSIYSDSSNIHQTTGYGMHTQTAVINDIQFFMSNGNITGTLNLYGIVNA